MQGHNRAPRGSPDKCQGNDYLYGSITNCATKELEIWIAKPEGFNAGNSSHCQGTANPEGIGNPVKHRAKGGKKAPARHFTPLVDTTLLGKCAAEFGGEQTIGEQERHSGDKQPGESLTTI